MQYFLFILCQHWLQTFIKPFSANNLEKNSFKVPFPSYFKLLSLILCVRNILMCETAILAFTKCDKVYGLWKKMGQLDIFSCSTLWPYQKDLFYSFSFLQISIHLLSMLLQLLSTIELTFHFINISKSTIKMQWKFVTAINHKTETVWRITRYWSQ